MKKYKAKVAITYYETVYQEANSAAEAKRIIGDCVARNLVSIELMDLEASPADQDVHTEHCCLTCGCKYANDNCTVTTEKKKQSFSHESCEGYERSYYT